MRTAKYTSNQHVVNSRYHEALQKNDLPISSPPFAGHSNGSKNTSRCYQPTYPTATKFHIMQSLHFSCDNYLIIADNESSVIRYFIYLREFDIRWNSKIKFIILLRVQFGYSSTNEFMVRCRFLLQNLWEEFKVMNVIIMTASIMHNRYVISEEVIVYNPFLPTHGGTQRGTIFTVNGSTSEILSRNSTPKFHGYPLRIVVFQRFPTAVPRVQCHLDDKNCTVTYKGMEESRWWRRVAAGGGQRKEENPRKPPKSQKPRFTSFHSFFFVLF